MFKKLLRCKFCSPYILLLQYNPTTLTLPLLHWECCDNVPGSRGGVNRENRIFVCVYWPFLCCLCHLYAAYAARLSPRVILEYINETFDIGKPYVMQTFATDTDTDGNIWVRHTSEYFLVCLKETEGPRTPKFDLTGDLNSWPIDHDGTTIYVAEMLEIIQPQWLHLRVWHNFMLGIV